MAVYYASKAYVVSLSQALRNELKHKGIFVTALCPGVKLPLWCHTVPFSAKCFGSLSQLLTALVSEKAISEDAEFDDISFLSSDHCVGRILQPDKNNMRPDSLLTLEGETGLKIIENMVRQFRVALTR